ncbi:penicillin-binding protein [Desulfuromonas carbonis]|uniref:penicillin-binding protein n=1 Tax=Desulfuromonas sp. DDH964 TaxID=1823759 RepID=UPI00078CD52D|nr:penicillin-binding protein [Desulfuromonas sp. DDH964]AMV73116.1 peptidoglycan transglycosylase and transpeptidase FtsI [Desulfuromonas sp. DDH964]
MEKWVRVRIRLVGLCFLAAFGFVAARAFHLQVLGQANWERRAERQHQKVIPLIPKRGTIYDRNGESLAVSLEVDSVYLEPTKVTDRPRTARLLADALGLKVAAVRAKLDSEKGFLWLKRQITPRESELVRALNLEGVGFTREHRRFYPNSELGAQVIGFTGLDPEGLEGLELKYDSLILGQGGFLVMERDALGRGIGGGEEMVQGGEQGSDLHLTLDKNLQFIAEKELAAGVKGSHARAGTVVVLNPANGEILAMASQPDFNPNAFYRYRPGQWRNRALCDTYEPGSTIKMFLLAAALNEGVVKPGTFINCENGSWRVGGKTIHDHHPYGRLKLPEILKVSSNIGAAKIGKALEREKYYGYLRDFGFGEVSGLELPGEQSGLLRKPSQWFEIDLAAISFGQGLTVTPLQVAMATAAIANGGYLMKPYVVASVVNSYGEVVESHRPSVRKQVISTAVAKQIRDMLVEVTEEGGTGTLATVPGYRVAGKTGTAQKVDPVTGTYSTDKNVASFVGFVPADDPKLVILVVLDEPEGQTYGGLVAAPVFSRIAAQGLRYLKVPPREPVGPGGLPSLDEILARNEVSTDVPVAVPGRKEGDAPVMPNCLGMSYRQVLQTMENVKLNIRLQGSGRVVDQYPKPGSLINFGSEVWVRLAPPA